MTWANVTFQCNNPRMLLKDFLIKGVHLAVSENSGCFPPNHPF